jgi:hypothetical protein
MVVDDVSREAVPVRETHCISLEHFSDRFLSRTDRGWGKRMRFLGVVTKDLTKPESVSFLRFDRQSCGYVGFIIESQRKLVLTLLLDVLYFSFLSRICASALSWLSKSRVIDA